MKNTRIHYLYRDGCNNKKAEEVVLAGELTFEEIAPFLDEGLFFIPGQVGLEDLQTRFHDYPIEADHPWHELHKDDLELTEDEPTCALTPSELREAFACVMWDESWEPEEEGREKQ